MPADFLRPGAARAGRGQIGAADPGDVLIVAGPDRVRQQMIAVVAGRIDEALTLRREFLEDRVQRGGVGLPAPG